MICLKPHRLGLKKEESTPFNPPKSKALYLALICWLRTKCWYTHLWDQSLSRCFHVKVAAALIRWLFSIGNHLFGFEMAASGRTWPRSRQWSISLDQYKQPTAPKPLIWFIRPILKALLSVRQACVDPVWIGWWDDFSWARPGESIIYLLFESSIWLLTNYTNHIDYWQIIMFTEHYLALAPEHD